MIQKIFIAITLALTFALNIVGLFVPGEVPLFEKILETWNIIEAPLLAALMLWGLADYQKYCYGRDIVTHQQWQSMKKVLLAEAEKNEAN
jgi:hypothetical protein